MVFLIDLDGTLIDSEHLHHEAWARVLGISHIYTRDIITEYGIDYLLKDFTNPVDLRRRKIKEMLKFSEIKLMKNADKFIDFISENNINHVVVTNTDRRVVEHFRKKLPILNKLKNWIVREDYDKPKPNSECYELALKLYGNGDKEIIGFENSPEGVNSMRGVTDNVFVIYPETDYLNILSNLR